jgi:hypothetical protein
MPMTKRCPDGHENPDNADFCQECRYKFSRFAEVKGGARRAAHAVREEYSKHGWIGSVILFIVGAISFSYLYYLTPIARIIELIRQMIYGYVPEPWNNFLFQFMPIILVITIFAIFMLRALFRRLDIRSFFSFFPDFLYVTGGILLGAAIFMGIGYLVYSYLLVAGALDPYLCTSGFILSTLVKIDPKAAERCAGLGPETPDYEKTGTINFLESKAGSEFITDEENRVPPIFKGENYLLPITIKNLDEKNSVDELTVEGYMESQSEEDRIIKLIPGVCSADAPCSIRPASSQVVYFESEEKIDLKARTYVDIIINERFPFVGFGKGEAVAVKSDDELASYTFTKPGAESGPVDVVVFFSPRYFLLDGTLSKVKMFVSVVNKGRGEVEVKSIEISRLGKFDLLGSATCKIPGSEITFNENTKQEFEDISFKTQIQFSCDLPIQTGGGNSDIMKAFGIPFTAVFEYNYVETVKDSLLEGIPVKEYS